MTFSKHATLPAMLGAVALSLTLALTGCGQSNTDSADTAEKTEETTEESTSTEATDDAATDEATDDEANQNAAAMAEAGDEEVEVPADLAPTAKATRNSIKTDDTEGADEFEALPTAEDEEVDISGSDLEANEDEEVKAASGWLTWYSGGIHMDMPIKWKSHYDEKEGCAFLSPDETVYGTVYSAKKESGTTYDVEKIVKAVPKNNEKEGFTNVTIADYDTVYTTKSNKLVGAYIIYFGDYQGKTYMHYVEVIESKSYINCIEFLGDIDGMSTNAKDVDSALETVDFNAWDAL